MVLPALEATTGGSQQGADLFKPAPITLGLAAQGYNVLFEYRS